MPRPSWRTCAAQVVVRGNRLSRVTNLGAYTMRSIFVAFWFSISICAVVEAADAQPSALAGAAGAVRVPMLFTGAVAASYPPPPRCHPDDFARGAEAARVDVAQMDECQKSVPALRRKGWPAPGYAGEEYQPSTTYRETWAARRVVTLSQSMEALRVAFVAAKREDKLTWDGVIEVVNAEIDPNSGHAPLKPGVAGRGLHSSTLQLNLSALYGIGGARRGRKARGKGVFRVCSGFPCVRHGSS